VRKKYFIEPRFQALFIVKFCLIVIVSSIVLSGIVLVLSDSSTTVTIENARVQVRNTVDFILPLVVQAFWIAAGFSAVCVALLALLTSHRISGPLYRLKEDAQRLANGDLRAGFKIRSSDQVQEFADSLARMSASLRVRMTAMRDDVDELKKRIDKADSVPEDVREIVNSLDERFKGLTL
jgi:methyl-accepting chemotaxis protein